MIFPSGRPPPPPFPVQLLPEPFQFHYTTPRRHLLLLRLHRLERRRIPSSPLPPPSSTGASSCQWPKFGDQNTPLTPPDPVALPRRPRRHLQTKPNLREAITYSTSSPALTHTLTPRERPLLPLSGADLARVAKAIPRRTKLFFLICYNFGSLFHFTTPKLPKLDVCTSIGRGPTTTTTRRTSFSARLLHLFSGE